MDRQPDRHPFLYGAVIPGDDEIFHRDQKGTEVEHAGARVIAYGELLRPDTSGRSPVVVCDALNGLSCFIRIGAMLAH